ncbi:hypothetical protein BDZ89DRAFT_1047326, partial [Hymenopellis radicata]
MATALLDIGCESRLLDSGSEERSNIFQIWSETTPRKRLPTAHLFPDLRRADPHCSKLKIPIRPTRDWHSLNVRHVSKGEDASFLKAERVLRFKKMMVEDKPCPGLEVIEWLLFLITLIILFDSRTIWQPTRTFKRCAPSRIATVATTSTFEHGDERDGSEEEEGSVKRQRMEAEPTKDLGIGQDTISDTGTDADVDCRDGRPRDQPRRRRAEIIL